MALKTKLQREVNISSREKISVQMLHLVQTRALLNKVREQGGGRGSPGDQKHANGASLSDKCQKHFVELVRLELHMKKKFRNMPEKGTLKELNYCDLSIKKIK